MAAVSLSTLRALFQAPAITKTMLRACRAVTDVISSCMLAEERDEHTGNTDNRISRYATSKDRNNTPS